MTRSPEADPPAAPPVEIELRLGEVAHGGHCVARHEGRVVFVRHGLPGELVRARITADEHAAYRRADAVDVLEPSPWRVPPGCEISGPGGCGGCDFQHVSAEGQLELKTRVVAEQLRRLAGLDWAGRVEAVPPSTGWRTRMGYQSTPQGRLGLRAARSHVVIALPDRGCAIAHPDARPALEGHPGDAGLDVVATGDGPLVVREGLTLTERALGRDYTVAADGFWQVHPRAAEILAGAVAEGLAPQPGERAFDLYCGVGLFAGMLADAGVQVWGVEASRRAIDHARRNVPEARFSVGRVDRALATLPRRTDLVVLDPPRSGAGRRVCEQVLARKPRAIAYVACDPAALARDLGTLTGAGYALAGLRAFDLFPNTQHVECVAILHP